MSVIVLFLRTVPNKAMHQKQKLRHFCATRCRLNIAQKHSAFVSGDSRIRFTWFYEKHALL